MKFTFPPESTPLAGYRIKRGIHRGGFGEVYYAHTEAGKEVALKLLQSQLEVELRGVRQCLNLKHPNLVGLYDIRIDDDGDHWIVMEYVAGRNLADVLDVHSEGLPVEEVVGWIDGMAAGLDFLHDRGIVHRDLKPGNVFVEQGLVKIGDVGLSKYISQSRRNEQTQSVGTVYYMAPEVAHGRYGREVDVYSLGCVLFELLTGRVPFEGESTGEILMKHLSEEPNLDAIEPRFRRVLKRALEKDPAKRLGTAGALARAFRKAAAAKATAVPVLAGVATAAGGPTPPSVEFDAADRETPVTAHHVTPASAPVQEGSAGTQPWVCSKAPPFIKDRPWLPWVAALAALAGIGLVAIPQVVVPFGFVALAVYCARRAWIAATQPDPNTRTQSVKAVQFEPRRPRERARCVQRHKASELLSPDTPRRIPFRQRLAEWSGSLAYAVPVSAVVVLGVFLASPLLPVRNAFAIATGTVDAGLLGHFALVTLLGSWAILTLAKFAEGNRVNGLHRRLAYFLAGSLVGAAAFSLHETLLVELQDGFVRNHHHTAIVDQLSHRRPLLDASGQPGLHAYMLFFGLLFAVRAWWRHVDGLRDWRLQVWTVGVTAFVGFLLPSIFAFPHAWGMLWAASISIVTQLAAPWMSPGDRRQLIEGWPRA